MRPLVGPAIGIAVLASGLLHAAEPADAGPEPGDVDESFPIVEEAPSQADPAQHDAPSDAGPAGPARKRPKPRPVDATAETAPDTPATAAHVDDTARQAAPDADSRHAIPAPGAAAAPSARVDASAAHVDGTPPRADPDAARHDPPPPNPPPPAPVDAVPAAGLGFGGVPAINFSSDDGFGFGVVGSLFIYDGKTKPYRASITLQLFMTSKLVQDHNVIVDWLDVADLPLRLYSRVGYLQSLTQNYCGLGGTVTCDPRAAGNDPHFYQRRFIDPYGLVLARWKLVDKPARFELTAGYRGFYFLPGSWDDANKDGKPDLVPYPGSLYAKDFPAGEPGFDSALSFGFMLDTRDNEPAPTEGIWLEASARGAAPAIASSWTWAGGNFTLRAYAPFDDAHKLVWANRFVVDTVIGDPPIQELARVGGSNDYYVYGGSEDGRGIRAQRYLGKLRAFDQNELRWTFAGVSFLDQRFAFTAVGFADVGVVGREVLDPGPMDLLPGFGGALRIAWNENFIVRFDVGVSPIENYEPQLYILIGNPF